MPSLRRLLLTAATLMTLSHPSPAPAAITSLGPPYPVLGDIERLDPALDALLAPDAAMEQLATGFNWPEGPVWMAREGQLVFSDVPENTAYRWRESAGVDVFLQPSGRTAELTGAREPGSNGLALDAAGRLLLAQHGDRRIARLAEDGRSFVTLADRFDGKRFNSPNDLCVDRAGNIFFTDPPYGLGGTAVAELDFHGVYRVAPDGTVTLLTRELDRPNGLALSPDERTLYVANSDGKRPVILAFALTAEGTLADPAAPGRVFFDASELLRDGRRGGMDGLKVDTQGHLWATGPGGVLILDPQGRHLGTLRTGKFTANCTFGGPDGTTLYVTADDVLVRLATRVRGAAVR